MKVTCQCCKLEAEYKDAQAAFDEGWDLPPFFTGYVCCPLCPAVCIVLGKGHKKAHAHWAEHGRPKEFSIGTCATDDMFGDAIKLKEAEDGIEEISKALADAKITLGDKADKPW